MIYTCSHVVHTITVMILRFGRRWNDVILLVGLKREKTDQLHEIDKHWMCDAGRWHHILHSSRTHGQQQTRTLFQSTIMSFTIYLVWVSDFIHKNDVWTALEAVGLFLLFVGRISHDITCIGLVQLWNVDRIKCAVNCTGRLFLFLFFSIVCAFKMKFDDLIAADVDTVENKWI